MDDDSVLSRRFITLGDLQVILAISRSQAYALVRTGDLRALRVGGRSQWRVELTELEAYIARCYREAAADSRRANSSEPGTNPELADRLRTDRYGRGHGGS